MFTLIEHINFVPESYKYYNYYCMEGFSPPLTTPYSIVVLKTCIKDTLLHDKVVLLVMLPLLLQITQLQ